MAKELHELTEKYLTTCPYDELQEILNKLNSVSIKQGNLVDSTEFFGNCLEHLQTIKRRILNDKSLDLLPRKRKGILNFIDKIEGKLRHYIDLISFMRSNQEAMDIYASNIKNETTESLVEAKSQIMEKMATMLDTVKNDINDTKNKVEKDINDTKNEVEKDIDDAKNKVEKDIDDAKKKLNDSEHTILTHVLTLMGVFSTIIITIVSTVITSSTWLSSTNGSGAILAFTVPSAVSIMVSILLIAIIHSLFGEKDKKKFLITYTCIVITVLVIMTGWIVASQRSIEAIHTRYILDKTKYLVTESEGTKYFEVTFNDENHVFPYKKDLLHDDALYFCTQHNTIE